MTAKASKPEGQRFCFALIWTKRLFEGASYRACSADCLFIVLVDWKGATQRVFHLDFPQKIQPIPSALPSGAPVILGTAAALSKQIGLLTNDLQPIVRQIAGIGLFLVYAGTIPVRSLANSLLENGTIALKHRESERKVSGQRMLLVAKVHVSFPRFGEAIPEQCRV